MPVTLWASSSAGFFKQILYHILDVAPNLNKKIVIVSYTNRKIWLNPLKRASASFHSKITRYDYARLVSSNRDHFTYCIYV